MKNTFKVGDIVKLVDDRDISLLKRNSIYTILNSNCNDVEVINDSNNRSWYTANRFVLVDTLFEDIRKAQEFIGERIQDDDGYPSGGYFPTTIGVGNVFSENSRICDYLKDSGKELVVYVESDDNLSLLHEIVLYPEEVVIKLTDDYDAKINKKNVIVGCQTIPIDKVREILTAWETL